MSEFMKARFDEICPQKWLSVMDIIEVEEDVKTAFSIIGFKPNDFDKAFEEAWKTSHALTLSDFVYDVWWCCDES